MTNGPIVVDSVREHLWWRAALISLNTLQKCCRHKALPGNRVHTYLIIVNVVGGMWVCVCRGALSVVNGEKKANKKYGKVTNNKTKSVCVAENKGQYKQQCHYKVMPNCLFGC